MRSLTHLRTLGLLVALTLFVGTPIGLLGQEESEGQDILTLEDVKLRLKENKKHLGEAKRRGRAGDAAGVETALENYERGVEGLDRALSRGRFEGDVFQREEAYERVEQATRKHTEVLADLLESGKIPEQARPHVEHAIAVSQKGRTTALENLESARGQRREHEASRRRAGFGQPNVSGRSQGAGRPGGIGGPPTGIGGRPGGTPGAAGGGGRGRGPG